MTNMPNGIDVAALQQFAKGIAEDASKRNARFNVKTKWAGQTRSVATVSHYSLSGVKYERNFEIAADEPNELLGQNSAPNPQELLMAALNACLTVGYVVNAAAMGITVHSLEIETEGELDLRGFLGLDETVNRLRRSGLCRSPARRRPARTPGGTSRCGEQDVGKPRQLLQGHSGRLHAGSLGRLRPDCITHALQPAAPNGVASQSRNAS